MIERCPPGGGHRFFAEVRTNGAAENSYLYLMEPQIRPIRPSELALLEDLLYEAIWQPDAALRLQREVIRTPEVFAYVEAFGQRAGDCCLVAEVDGRVAGAAWSRVMHGFGTIDERTPELAVALFPDCRGAGIGTRLIGALLRELRIRGYEAVSLSVQRANPAARLYPRLGFRVVEEHGEELVMRCDLAGAAACELAGACSMQP